MKLYNLIKKVLDNNKISRKSAECAINTLCTIDSILNVVECPEEILDCNIDEERKGCEDNCKIENDIGSCETDCSGKCMEGGDWWKEYEEEREEQREEHKEEKGVFNVGGGCRTSQGETKEHIWFGGWGDPFSEIEELKHKYYSGGHADWCKKDLENLIRERRELEKGLNQEFVAWFFEEYLVNSAGDWEKHVSGIFELYWKDVDTSRRMVEMMNCVGIRELPSYNLINIEYSAVISLLPFLFISTFVQSATHLYHLLRLF